MVPAVPLETGAGIQLPTGPAVEDNPAGAWEAMNDAVQALLDSPEACGQPFSHPMAGDHRLEQAIGYFLLGDVLVHTWDLARATGQEPRVDEDEAAGMLAGMQPMDEMLRSSGHFGPRVEVDPGADVVTRLVAFTGRTP